MCNQRCNRCNPPVTGNPLGLLGCNRVTGLAPHNRAIEIHTYRGTQRKGPLSPIYIYLGYIGYIVTSLLRQWVRGNPAVTAWLRP
jgi:hypothetical protein